MERLRRTLCSVPATSRVNHKGTKVIKPNRPKNALFPLESGFRLVLQYGVMRRFATIALLIFCDLSAAAQRHTGEVFHSEVKGSRTAITLRVQRQERNTWSCALVYPGDKEIGRA